METEIWIIKIHLARQCILLQNTLNKHFVWSQVINYHYFTPSLPSLLPHFYNTNIGVTYISIRSRGQEYKFWGTTPWNQISLCFPIIVV